MKYFRGGIASVGPTTVWRCSGRCAGREKPALAYILVERAADDCEQLPIGEHMADIESQPLPALWPGPLFGPMSGVDVIGVHAGRRANMGGLP